MHAGMESSHATMENVFRRSGVATALTSVAMGQTNVSASPVSRSFYVGLHIATPSCRNTNGKA